jgi:hypothetical protein
MAKSLAKVTTNEEAKAGYDVAGFESALLQLKAKLDVFTSTLTHHATKDVFPQGVLEVGVLLERAAKMVKDAEGIFDDSAKLHKTTGGHFEIGRVAITFPETTKVSPKWKDEACIAGRALCEAKGTSYDEEVFVKSVQSKYPATTSVSVKLTKSEA